MKVVYFILGLVVGLLMQKPAHAVQFEIAVGQVEYQKSRATDWWQEGPASQGFYNEFNLKSTSYRVGLVGDLTSSVKYRVGYANLGSVSSRAGATNFDSEYDFDNKRCQSSGCEMVDYIGGGKVDGYYATLAPEYKLGKFAVYGEVGAWMYFPKFDMAKFHMNGAVDRLDIQGGTQYGPVVGFGVRHESMSLSVRFYKTDLNGAMNNASGIPAIYQGYASEVSLGWIF